MIDLPEPEIVLLPKIGTSTVAVMLAWQGWIELVNKGLTVGDSATLPTSSAILFTAPSGRDKVPAGVLVFDVREHVLTIVMAYVDPVYRGRGVFRSMWEAMATHVCEQMKDVQRIEMALHVQNQAARAVAKRCGMNETAVIARTDIVRS